MDTKDVPPKSSKFSEETGRVAGVLSGIARAPIDTDSVIKRAKKYAIMLMDIHASYILNPAPCTHCKRKGPADLKQLMDLTARLTDLIELICTRLEGKAPTMSRASSRATLAEFKKMGIAMRKANLGDLSPEAESLRDEDDLSDSLVPLHEADESSSMLEAS